MAKAVIAYDKDLPEIPGRRPWEKPTSYLIKDDAATTGWREETSGRRPSRLLLVPKIRAGVDPALLGGVVARVGGTVYDGSVRTQLKKLRDQLANQG